LYDFLRSSGGSAFCRTRQNGSKMQPTHSNASAAAGKDEFHESLFKQPRKVGLVELVLPSLSRRRIMFHQQGNAGLWLVVQHDVDRVQARVFELQLLNIDDEIACAEVHIFRQRDIDCDRWEVWHDRAAVSIDKIKAEIVLSLVAAEKGHAQRDGTLRMSGGELLGINRIERAQQVQLAVIVCRGVAQDRYLYVHDLPKAQECQR